MFRTTHAIVDSCNRVVGVLVGRPVGSEWDEEVTGPATSLFEQIRHDGDMMDAWSKKQMDARRGDFPAITAAVSYGGGQDVGISPPVLRLFSDVSLLETRQSQARQRLPGLALQAAAG